jgi:hypothetical protein
LDAIATATNKKRNVIVTKANKPLKKDDIETALFWIKESKDLVRFIEVMEKKTRDCVLKSEEVSHETSFNYIKTIVFTNPGRGHFTNQEKTYGFSDPFKVTPDLCSFFVQAAKKELCESVKIIKKIHPRIDEILEVSEFFNKYEGYCKP